MVSLTAIGENDWGTGVSFYAGHNVRLFDMQRPVAHRQKYYFFTIFTDGASVS